MNSIAHDADRQKSFSYFDLLPLLPSTPPVIVFTTAHDAFAFVLSKSARWTTC